MGELNRVCRTLMGSRPGPDRRQGPYSTDASGPCILSTHLHACSGSCAGKDPAVRYVVGCSATAPDDMPKPTLLLYGSCDHFRCPIQTLPEPEECIRRWLALSSPALLWPQMDGWMDDAYSF